jgi:predicted esterase
MPSTTHHIAVTTHGRYLTTGDGPQLLVGFHGQGETAEAHLDALHAIAAGTSVTLVSVQALNRYNTRTGEIAACWMTRQDRELAIADNLAYVRRVIDAVESARGGRPGRLVYAGFSQGVAMAYRAAAFAGRRAAGLIALAGDLPPDVAPVAATLPPVLIGRGTTDAWYTAAKAADDLRRLREGGTNVEEFVFASGHVWDGSFIARARAFLDEHLKG